ncbi:WhiB family transcriptional regulator [Nocardia wallacei]|uniref:WhiB family transcriptional regulator n=1 Tax=Nocardia wallacei TaxID=480035 RepID=UPI0024565D51|nr:WhiB family transcriptional regulator [Nocardia wallacei]
MKPLSPVPGLGPVVHADRSCNGVDQDVFFPDLTDVAALSYARDICEGCPRLQECAAWAEPLARSGALNGCVVAGVRLPTFGKRGQSGRDAAADELAAVAESGQPVADVEGAA